MVNRYGGERPLATPPLLASFTSRVDCGHARPLIKDAMWRAEEHSDQENLQWAWLRAIEWIGWPLFMSQPVVPVLLYFYDWPWILVAVLLTTLLWRVTVLQWFVSVRLADFGPLFVLLKFVVCPVMAFLIWQQGNHVGAALALLWPLVILVIASPLAIFQTLLGSFFPIFGHERTMYVGPVQERFMNALGYTHSSTVDEQTKQIIRHAEQNARTEPAPFHALASAIILAVNQCKEGVKPLADAEAKQDPALLELRLIYEFLYFFIHMTTRSAFSEGFTHEQIDKLGQAVYRGLINFPLDSLREDIRDLTFAELWAGLNAAEREFKPLIGDSLLAKLSRSVAERIGRPYNPEVMMQVTAITAKELRNVNLPKLVQATKAFL